MRVLLYDSTCSLGKTLKQGIGLPVRGVFASVCTKTDTGASYNGSTTVSKTVSVGSIPPAPATRNTHQPMSVLLSKKTVVSA